MKEYNETEFLMKMVGRMEDFAIKHIISIILVTAVLTVGFCFIMDTPK